MSVALSKKWWLKNKPSCLSKSEIDTCIGNYDATVNAAAAKKWKIDEKLGKSIPKSIETMQKAVQKDSATAKKAKDKKAEQLLKDVLKDVDSKKSEFDKHLQLKNQSESQVANGGMSGAPSGADVASSTDGQAAKAASGGGAAVVTAIVNAASAGWKIMQDGKATLSSGSKFCQALPKGKSFTEFSGWKTFSGSHTGHTENFFGVNVVEYDLTVTFQYLGTSSATGGWFVGNFSIFVKNASVSWGWSADIDASVSGSPFNAAKPEAPIGAIPLVLSISVAGNSKSMTSTKYTAYGNGKLTNS